MNINYELLQLVLINYIKDLCKSKNIICTNVNWNDQLTEHKNICGVRVWSNNYNNIQSICKNQRLPNCNYCNLHYDYNKRKGHFIDYMPPEDWLKSYYKNRIKTYKQLSEQQKLKTSLVLKLFNYCIKKLTDNNNKNDGLN